MQRPIKPEWLLRQAEQLAGSDAGAGQPRNADLRRAVSAAYYAIFHALTLALAARLLPSPLCQEEDRWSLARTFDHGDLRKACSWFASTTAPKSVQTLVSRAASNSDLADVAEAFVQMQALRHDADYDHVANFTRPEVLALIAQSRDAIRKLDGLKGTADHARFTAVLIATGKGRGL